MLTLVSLAMLKVVAVFAGFGLVIAFHELGHFLALKWFGIAVREFAVGMGPKLFSRWFGTTEFSLRALPTGGFVNAVGEGVNEAQSSLMEQKIREQAPSEAVAAYLLDPARRLKEQNRFARAVYIAAGPVFSFLLAIPLAVLLLVLCGEPLPTNPARVAAVNEEMPAGQAGMASGDELLAFNGERFSDSNALLAAMSKAKGKCEFLVKRKSLELSVSCSPIDGGGRSFFGVMLETKTRPVSAVEAVTKSFSLTFDQAVRQTKLVVALFSGKVSLSNLSGPVGIMKEMGSAAGAGTERYLSLLLMITIGLGVMNLIPIFPLDGGQLVVVGIESILRRPIPSGPLLIYQFGGVVALLGLTCFTLIKDIATF